MEWEDVTKLIQVFKDNELGELEYEDERFVLRLKAPGSTATAYAAPLPPLVLPPPSTSAPRVAHEVSDVSGHAITSPFVGSFYRQPAPDSPPYVEIGQIVSRGQVLCIVEAMKLMNEIEADTNGKIAKIYVENGKPVEFGERLFLIEAL